MPLDQGIKAKTSDAGNVDLFGRRPHDSVLAP